MKGKVIKRIGRADTVREAISATRVGTLGKSELAVSRLSEQVFKTHEMERVSALHDLTKPKEIGAWDAANVRPPRWTVLAHRLPAYQEAKSAGLIIPSISDSHEGQQACALFEVLAIGAGVESVKTGDTVVALHYYGVDVQSIFGADMVFLRTPEFVCDKDLRCSADPHCWSEHECHGACGCGACVCDKNLEHGSRIAREEGCRCGGYIDAVVEVA